MVLIKIVTYKFIIDSKRLFHQSPLLRSISEIPGASTYNLFIKRIDTKKNCILDSRTGFIHRVQFIF